MTAYISHNTEVKVVDAESGAIVGSVAGLKRVHGIVVMDDLGRGFISDGGADEVVVFDVKTLKATGHIKTRAIRIASSTIRLRSTFLP